MSDKVFQAIAELIAERNDTDPAEVTRDTRFQDVGIDSLDTVEMLITLRTRSASRSSCRRRSRPSASWSTMSSRTRNKP